MKGEVIAALIAALAALIATTVSYFQYRTVRRDKNKFFDTTRQDQVNIELNRNLFDALKWFEGKTQRRSIGISVVEAYWEDKKELQKIWKPLLVNQAIHILKRSEDKDSSTEHNNLERIISLIRRGDIESDQKKELRDALEKANIKNGDVPIRDYHKTGIFIDEEKRETWIAFFK